VRDLDLPITTFGEFTYGGRRRGWRMWILNERGDEVITVAVVRALVARD